MAIVVPLEGDPSEYLAELEKMRRQTKATGERIQEDLKKKMGEGGGKAGQALGAGFGKALKGALQVVALQQTASALIGLQQGAHDLVNEVNDLSTRTGIASSTLSGLRLAAQGSGLDFKALEATLAKVPKLMGDVGRGQVEITKKFRALGVETHDVNGMLRDGDSVFRDIIGRLQEIEDPTERAAAATSIFEVEGSKLLQSLGGVELETFVDQAERFGVDIGPEASAAANNWQRSMAELKTVTGGATQELLAFLSLDKSLENFTAGVVFMKELVVGSLELTVSKFQALFNSIDAARRGDFRTAASELGEALKPMALSAGEVASNAIEATKEFLALQAAARGAKPELEGAGDEGDKTAQHFGQLAHKSKGASEALKELKKHLEESRAAAEVWRERIQIGGSEENELLLTYKQELTEITRLERERALTQEEAIAARLESERVFASEMAELRESEREDLERAAEEKRRDHEDALSRWADERTARLDIASTYIESAQTIAGALMEQLNVSKGAARAMFMIDKGLSLASIFANTKKAVVAALANPPGPPVTIPAATAAGVFGAAQAAAVVAQKPRFHSGLATAGALAAPAPAVAGGAPDEVPATLTRPERVLTATGARAMGGDRAIAAANRGESSRTTIDGFSDRALKQLRAVSVGTSGAALGLAALGPIGLIAGLGRKRYP